MDKLNRSHIISFVAMGGIIFVAFNFSGSNTQPLFSSLDNFVLFAEEEIKLEQDIQVSSGDVGSNKDIDIQKDAIINGNLFADKITIDKNTLINGNVSFNKIQTKKETQILGTKTSPISLPIANLPEIPDFQIGVEDFNFTGATNTLAAGNYRNIVLEKNSRLVLTGGVYNLDKLDLQENSVLIFATTTILNIKSELKAQQKISILSGQNTKFDDLRINLKSAKPTEFGKNSFLNFKLLAPKASVYIRKETILRGQILARKIKIEKDSVLSMEEVFVKEGDPSKVIIDTDGSQFVVNEIMVNFVDGVTFSDAQDVADLVSGRIIGFVKSANTYQIEVIASTPEELSVKIQTIRQLNNLLIEGVFRNYLLNVF